MTDNEEMLQEGIMIRDLLRAKRAAMPELTNQDIANMAGLTVNTVNHCLSERSKSSSAFTIGRLCKALHVSFDQAFGIIPDDNEKDKVLLQEQIEKLEEKCSRQERELLHKEELEKRSREILNETARSLKANKCFSRFLIGLCVAVIVLFVAYLLYFDLPNPGFGIIRSEAFFIEL